MKKLVALLLSCTMMIILTACNEKQPTSSSSAASPAGTVTSAPSGSSVEKWPTDTVEILSTYKEGGSLDIMLRALAPCLQEELGVPVIVTAMPGGNTIVATEEYFNNREADGNTIYATLEPAISYMNIMLGNEHTYNEFDWINVQEIDYVSILVPENSPFQTLEELLAYTKEHPGELSYGSMTMTSSSGPAFKLLIEQLGLDVKEVTYESGAVLRPAVLGGEVDVAGVGAYADWMYFGAEGGVRCLGYFSNNKLDGVWPDAVPLNDVTVPNYGVEFPELGDQRLLGVSKEFKEKYPERWEILYDAYQRAITSDAMKEYYSSAPSLLQNNTPEESLDLIKSYDSVLSEYKYLFE